MIRYWEEDTETEIGKPFDLEKHDKEISDRWLAKIKQAREEMLRLGTFGEPLSAHHFVKIMDNLIAESEG